MHLKESQIREILNDWALFNHGKKLGKISWTLNFCPEADGIQVELELQDLVEVKDAEG